MTNEGAHKPFGKEGPTVRVLSERETPKKGSKITPFGLRILNSLPIEKELTLSSRTLIERLRGLGDYDLHMKGIKALAEAGYLNIDEDGQLSLTNEGKKELPKRSVKR